MSKMTSYVRGHKRAPFYSWCLYQHEDYGLKARVLNISEGGLLLESLPAIPAGNSFSVMIDLPLFPHLSMMTMKDLLKLCREELESSVIRAQVEAVRKVEGKSDVDHLFMVKIGSKFIGLGKQEKSRIETYVLSFSKNLVYLLSLFESGVTKPDKILFIKHVAKLLGYNDQQKISQIRQQVLHDYQSQ